MSVHDPVDVEHTVACDTALVAPAYGTLTMQRDSSLPLLRATIRLVRGHDRKREP